MELGRGSIVAGVVITIAVAAAAAWWTTPRPAPGPLPAAARDAASSRAEAPPALYKWQDAQGVWNYTDRPPPDGPFETIRDTPNVTTVDSVVPEVPGAPASLPPPPEE